MRNSLLAGPLSAPDLSDSTLRDEFLRAVAADDDPLSPDTGAAESFHSPDATTTLLRPGISSGLLDYQAELVEQVVGVCSHRGLDRAGLLTLPTGAGKTRTAVCAAYALMAKARFRKTLWLAPATELLEQAADAFTVLWPASDPTLDRISLVRARLAKTYPDVVGPAVYFATPQMLYRRLVHRPKDQPLWDLIVFDEAHLADAPTFRDSLSVVRESSAGYAPLLGLSATPGRNDERQTDSLVSLFQRRLFRSRLLGKDAFRALRDRGVLARIEFKQLGTVPGEPRRAQDMISDVTRFRRTVEACTLAANEGSTIVFSGSIDHAVALALVLRRRGVPAGWVSSRMPANERIRALRAFEAGALSVLVNKTLLATGYDVPAVKNVVLTVPVRSAVLFEQMVGRCARGPLIGGNAVSKVWYFEDHLKMHGAPSSYHRFRLAGWK